MRVASLNWTIHLRKGRTESVWTFVIRGIFTLTVMPFHRHKNLFITRIQNAAQHTDVKLFSTNTNSVFYAVTSVYFFSASSTRERYLQRTVTKPIRIHAFVYSKIRAFNYCKCLNFIILPYAYISLLSTSIKLVSKKRVL